MADRDLFDLVKERMRGLPPSHDFSHVMRVYKMCKVLADEDTDMDVLLTAALLHDVGRREEDEDPTGRTDHAEVSALIARRILKEKGHDDNFIEQVVHCIRTHRFRSGERPRTKEARILFDADKLDSLGAIGIARLFAWIGENGARIYADEDMEEYVRKNVTGGKANGRIRDKRKHAGNIEFALRKGVVEHLHTEKAREIARQRLELMHAFFSALEREATFGRGP